MAGLVLGVSLSLLIFQRVDNAGRWSKRCHNTEG